MAASKAAVELEPGSVAVKVARLVFAAKGGGDAERAETDTKDPRGSFSFESPLSDAQLAVIIFVNTLIRRAGRISDDCSIIRLNAASTRPSVGPSSASPPS